AAPRRSNDARVSAHRQVRPGRRGKLPAPSMILRRAGTVLVLVLAALVFALVAIGTGRALAAGLAAAAVGFALTLFTLADRFESTLEALSDAGERAIALTPGVLVIFFSFN